MAKTQQRKPAAQSPKSAGKETGSVDFLQNVKLQSRLIFIFVCLLYANTLRHGFVLDDGIVITENKYTQAGIQGIGGILSHDTFYGFFQQEGMDVLVSGGRYRPLSVIMFACIYQVFGDNAFPFHLVTVLLFALTCAVLYRTLLRLLRPENGDKLAYSIAWLSAVLFAVHPIHTEVVNNIKCCDEILALLGSLLALNYALRAWDEKQQKWAYAAGVALFLACLSKENAVAYAVLIPLAIWFFRPGESGAASIRPVMGVALPALVGVVAFLAIRGAILPWNTLAGNGGKELLNNPFLKLEGNQWVDFSLGERLATISYTLWKYVQLLFVPHPLTHDYYPRHIDITTFAAPLALAGIAVYGFMVYWVIRGFKRRDALAYALLLYLLPLGIVSNLLFPIGTNMSERFAFMPSAGFCLLAGLLAGKLMANKSALVWQVFGIAVLLFSAKTVTRNFVWESNEKLFLTDVAVSKNSLKIQNACAQALLERGKAEKDYLKQQALGKQALGYLNEAFKIYPDFNTSVIIRAGVYAMMQQYPEAVADYRKALAQAPDNPKRKEMLAFALREAGRYYGQQKRDLTSAFANLNEAWAVKPDDPETARLIGIAYMVQGSRDEALNWYVKAEQVAPDNAESLWELGVAYNNLGMLDKARELQQKAVKIDPKILEKTQVE